MPLLFCVAPRGRRARSTFRALCLDWLQRGYQLKMRPLIGIGCGMQLLITTRVRMFERVAIVILRWPPA
jgi:hypothetical protein